MRGRAGFGATLRAILLAPKAFFAAAPEARDERGFSAMAFASVVAAIGSGIGGLVGGLIAGNGGSALAAGAVAAIGAAVVVPLAVAITAALAHATLRLIGGARRPFVDTLGCFAFATAPSILSVVPVLGPIVAAIWQLVLDVLALDWVHRSGIGRAIAAVLAGPLFFVALALGLRFRVVEAFKIPSGAMIPTILVGDHVFVNKLAYRWPFGGPPARGDVVVFRFPEKREQDFVKRIIGIGGDTLEYLDGRPIVNGKLTPECYVGSYAAGDHPQELYVEFLGDRPHLVLSDAKHDERACATNADCGAELVCRGGVCGTTLQGPYHVAPGEVWVSGENRDNTYDSRAWNGGKGAGVPIDDVKGRVTIVWMSFGAGGAIANERLGVAIHGPPALPPSAPAGLRDALAACLAKGPPR